MKALTILPNFMIMAEVSNPHYIKHLFGILRCYCEIEANVEHVDSYKITPESFWDGMNIVENVDFIQLLKNNTQLDIPNNVLIDLEKFKDRFGLITLVGDDCLKVSCSDLLTEIKNNTRLNAMIYEYDNNLVFFKGNIKEIQEILHHDLFCPIKFRKSKIKTFLIKLKDEIIVVKAADALQSLKSLYNKHDAFNEDNLRKIMKYKKEKITKEVINSFFQIMMNDSNLTIYNIPSTVILEPVSI